MHSTTREVELYEPKGNEIRDCETLGKKLRIASVIITNKLWGVVHQLEDSARRARNLINGLYDDNGVWSVGQKDLKGVVIGHFSRLFMASAMPSKDVTQVQAMEWVSDFRPISLCNVIYKVVVKALENRLRSVLGEVISESQSAFVPRRLISDNAIIGIECLYAIRTRK
ncbi:hypothetical protein Q3G72_026790 [Acer saccharum]|nr:hypothetical protein Q3G72_026790 [Acer saccharum]